MVDMGENNPGSALRDIQLRPNAGGTCGASVAGTTLQFRPGTICDGSFCEILFQATVRPDAPLGPFANTVLTSNVRQFFDGCSGDGEDFSDLTDTITTLTIADEPRRTPALTPIGLLLFSALLGLALTTRARSG